jgi:hemolysin III
MNKFREPVSGLTHLFGAVISLLGMNILIIQELSTKNVVIINLVAVIAFGLSMIALYTASSVYHLTKASDKVIKRLRKLDHSMIYVLIAGTYTPISLISLSGYLRWGFFILIWAIAGAGIFLKLYWFNAPRWLSTLFYVLMGWLSVFIIYPISKVLPGQAIAWLAAGGIMYTVGAVLYATKWPKIKSNVFGFHEIFHLFVLAGTFCHYWMIMRYVA